MAKPTPSGSIAINPSSVLELGGTVVFDVSTADIKRKNNVLVSVIAYQGEGTVFVGIVEEGETILLGGASSTWLSNGGPAECIAQLYYWNFHPVQKQVLLDQIEFSADG